MADAMLDARQQGDSYRRIEVITGQRRRRRWTAQEKARIVAESFEEGANISEVARRNGVVRGVCTENSNPNVLVMKSAQDGVRSDDAGSLNRARDRRIFVQ